MTEEEGRNRGPEKLGDLIDRLFSNPQFVDRKGGEDLIEAWRDVAGPGVASRTKVKGFRGGVLTVAVESAPLMHELTMYQKDELLKALRERLTGRFVEELAFRLV